MKKLALAIVAFLAVGASAQSRLYLNEEGIVRASADGVVQAATLEMVGQDSLYHLPLNYVLFPVEEPVRLNARYYWVDAADTADLDLLEVETEDDVILEFESDVESDVFLDTDSDVIIETEIVEIDN